MIFFILFFQKIICDCSFKSNLITINDNTSLADLKDEYRPLFLRLTSPGCPYSPASQVHWEAAAELFPQVDFITINCWQNTAICSLFGYPINTPYHGFVLANTSEVYDNEDAKFGRPSGINDIEKSPTKFIDVITKYANLYPISPPLANLVPMISDSFYKNAGDPIILLYNSECTEEVPFLNAWSKAANEELLSNGDYSTIGLLDCSKYPDECLRWSRPYVVRTPRALVYSGKTGNFEILDSYDQISQDKIQNLLTNAGSLPTRPTPSPVPNPSPNNPILSPDDYEVLENSNLQNRPLSEVKQKYVNFFKAPEGGPCLKGCGDEHVETITCDDIPPNPKDHESSLNVINMFRWLAGLSDDVAEDDEWSKICEKTAHNIHRTGRVPSDHIIKDNYLTDAYCGDPSYKQVALDSLLSENSNSCFESTYKLFKDEGSNNDGVVGHRRYLLHPDLKKVGFGFYPFKLEKIEGNRYWQRPAVNLLRIKENGNLHYIENGVPENLKFISWPPAGPFPIDHLPTNWHISHPMFKNLEITDLEILVTRDDGIELPITRAVIEKYSVNKDSLILIMSKEAISRCQALHKINVFVKNKKDKKFIRYSFELFNTNEFTEVCFYNTNKDKCPSTIDDSNKINSKFEESEFLSKATNLVKIHVVESIKLTNELIFSAKQRFVVSGDKIQGVVHIRSGVVVDFQDPSETDFVIDWSVQSKKVGKLDTAMKAKSISVNVIDEIEDASLDNIVFYTGRETQCSLSKSVLRGSNKDVYYTFGGTNYNYVLISSPCVAYENFIVGDAFDSFTDLKDDYPGVQVNSLNEMKNQNSYKRVVRIFINPTSTDYIQSDAFIPGTKKDYIFVKTGNIDQYFRFYCDYSIRDRANSITFQDLSDRFGQSLPPYKFNLVAVKEDYSRQRCEIDNITIRNAAFNGFYSKDIFFPSVKGDEKAKIQFPYVYIDQTFARENVFDAQRPATGGKTQTEIKIDGKYDEYIIKVDFKGLSSYSTLYKWITILPDEGCESKPYKFKFVNRDDDNDNYPISNSDFPTVYFENFKDVKIEHPVSVNEKSYLDKFVFLKCGKVSFNEQENSKPIETEKLVLSAASDTQINYGVTLLVDELSAQDSGTFHVPNIEAKSLTVANQQEFVEVKVTQKISIDSSTLTLNKCQLQDEIVIDIVKSKNVWPSVSLVGGTEIKNGQINIDLKMANQNKANLFDDQNQIEYEDHVMIGGIESGCDSLLSSTKLINNDNFEVKCSKDNKNMIVARGTKPDHEEIVEEPSSSVNIDDGVPSNDEDKSENDAVVPSNDEDKSENDAVVPSKDEDKSENDAVVPSKDEDKSENQPINPGSEDGGGKSFPVGGIIGIVIGVIVVITIVVIVVVIMKKKKKNDEMSNDEGNDENDDVGL